MIARVEAIAMRAIVIISHARVKANATNSSVPRPASVNPAKAEASTGVQISTGRYDSTRITSMGST